MRYELDNEGYVLNVYFGCISGSCIEYTGNIPDGYDCLGTWAENANIRAYKLVDGNLAFDAARDAELQNQYNAENEQNRCLTKKDLYKINEKINQNDTSLKEQYQTSSARGKIVKLNNANALSPNILINNISCYEYNKIKLIATNKNMLPNTATSKTINGIEFTQNEDRSIAINGTATNDIEYNIAGTSSNTSPILVFKKDTNYYLSSNNQTIKMYNYDGTDREEVYSGNGGSIVFSEDKKITQIVLSVSQETQIDITVYPQLELGTSASEYITHQEYDLEIDFTDYIEDALFPSDNLFPSDTLFPSGTTIGYIKIEDNSIYALVNNKEASLNDGYLSVLSGINYIYSIEDNYLNVTYYTNILNVDDLDFMRGKSTSTNKFRVLEDGSIEAHNGNFSGNIFLENGNKVIGGDGLMTNIDVSSVGQYQNYSMIGFNCEFGDGLNYSYQDINIDVDIPTNFKIEKAYVVVEHTSAHWEGQEDINNYQSAMWNANGHARNVKLYKSNGNDDCEFYMSYASEWKAPYNKSLDEIDGAFGVNGFTGNNTLGATTKHISKDIKEYLNTGKNKLILRTSEAMPTSQVNYYDASIKTGMARATLHILGYTNIS